MWNDIIYKKMPVLPSHDIELGKYTVLSEVTSKSWHVHNQHIFIILSLAFLYYIYEGCSKITCTCAIFFYSINKTFYIWYYDKDNFVFY
jgi:hypothetical protein